MEELYLIKFGEISLKKGNKKVFERKLKDNIKNSLKGYKNTVLIKTGRIYLTIDECPEEEVYSRVSKVPGIVWVFKTEETTKDLESISKLAFKIVDKNLEKFKNPTFKIETRRTDKSLTLDSYGFSRELGSIILDKYGDKLTVDVKKPDFTIHLELREKAYIYGYGVKGPSGLPVGTSGRGTLLLSGGIDSPVAGTLMAKRGMKMDAVYFHTPPYTSEESYKKVVDLTKIITPWCGGVSLFTIPFTKIQLKINKEVPPEYATLMGRACMMRIATLLSELRQNQCLITGESVGQVASQTIESLHFTGANTHLPVIRPLIGMDKEQIILIAKEIGTYETSIIPFDDCCAMFAPLHPETRPEFAKTMEIFNSMGIEPLLLEALENRELVELD